MSRQYTAMPDSPTDVNADGVSDIEDPLSPLDPHPLARDSKRETAGHDFFSAVFLDSPLHPAEQEELEEARFGGTRPLRVRKRVAGVGRAARQRRSNVSSVPQSPGSSRGHGDGPSSFIAARPTPSIVRSNTSSSTTSSIQPHHSISRLFVAAPSIPESPPPTIPSKHVARSAAYSALSLAGPGRNGAPLRPPRLVRPARSPARSPKRYPSPELHLNLGTMGSYDDVSPPGPSPPWSAASSPNMQSSTTAHFASQPLPPVPALPSTRDHLAPPLTPSRAPAKAAKLLGASVSEIGNLHAPAPPIRNHKKKDHFRPLPSQTLVEIDRFFGGVPAKPSKISKPPPTSTFTRPKISGPLHLGGDGLGERNLGQGGTVRYKGEDGTTWQDMEEEQEFAWLMGESYAAAAPVGPNPPVRSITAPVLSSMAGMKAKVTGAGKGYAPIRKDSLDRDCVDRAESDDSGDADAVWGMDTFTSVLSLPKGKKARKVKPSTDESFFDFDDDEAKPSKMTKAKPTPKPKSKSSRIAPTTPPTRPTRPVRPARLDLPETLLPWSSSTESLQLITPPRSHSDLRADAHVTGAKAPSPGSDGLDSDGQYDLSYGSSPPRADSPPRLRNRPPPLTLAPPKYNPRLPVISTTPGTGIPSKTPVRPYHAPAPLPRESIKIDSLPPITPFVRPRRAPVPGNAPDVPQLPGADAVASSVPMSRSMSRGIAIPTLPPMLPMHASRAAQPSAAYTASPQDDDTDDDDMLEISYFEPDTPTDDKSATRLMNLGLGHGHGHAHSAGGSKAKSGHARGEANESGGAGWLKKVVKPRGGTRI